MKILVMGGSYFYGRVFTMSACEKHELTLLNRGTYPMNDYPVKEIKADRKDESALKEALKEALSDGGFDAVVDFCAYDDKQHGCGSGLDKVWRQGADAARGHSMCDIDTYSR